MYLKSQTNFGVGGFVVSIGDIGKETSGAGNRTDGRRGIDSDAITGLCGEKYGMDSKIVTSADSKYFLVEGL